MKWFRRRKPALPTACQTCGQPYRIIWADPNDCYRFQPCGHPFDSVAAGVWL